MTTEAQRELQSFHEFVAEQLKLNPAMLTPEKALALWRERAETIASAKRGLDDLDAGRVWPVREVLDTLGQESN